MKLIKQIVAIILTLLSVSVKAQEGYTERAKNYVKQYAAYAIADQRSTGVPAAVTLGQGILETEAGLSELMVKANNHFGIKCKNNWQGETFLHTDDAKDECFKKYASAQESYHDHSAHLLKNPRYKILFTYSQTDYAKWAHGLKKCGYATNPKYAYQLIKIIEEYRLQEFSYAALDSNYKIEENILLPGEETAIAANDNTRKEEIVTMRKDTTVVKTVAKATASEPAAPNKNVVTDTITAVPNTAEAVANTEVGEVDRENILTANGLKAVFVHKDESLLPYAIKYRIRYAHLLEMNDLPDEPLAFDTYLYLEKKHALGLKSKHQVKDGETLLMVAQEEGIQLKKLAALNLLQPNEQPVTGTALYLQEPASVKPNVRAAVYVYQDYSATPAENELAAEQNTSSVSKSTAEVGFGMGFEAPKEDAENLTSADKMTGAEIQAGKQFPATQVEETNGALIKKQQPQTQQQSLPTEEESQPQLRKPATEKVYGKGDKFHIVRRGETAYSIAKKNGITVAQLLSWNSIEAQDLKAGQTIIVKK
jgi:LysM repeat protein